MATKVIISPGKYIQGKNEITKIATYTQVFGQKPFVIADEFVMHLVLEKVTVSYEQAVGNFEAECFHGECSKEEIERLKQLAQSKQCDMVVGIGGGKTLDTAKAIGYYMNWPVMIVPTIASTDAPCSALSVLYTKEGVFDKYLPLPTNPQIVLMDTQIIAGAPTRLLVSGMGDALATYFEARACKRSGAQTMAGGEVSEAAFCLAKLCYDTLIQEGLKAKLASESKIANEALSKVIEANTYLSGIGFESGGLAGAHAIHNGLTVLEACHHLYHGEKVAFGTLTQLVLENAPLEEIQEVLTFCKSVGLPTTLEAMGAKETTTAQLYAVAEAATVAGETIHNMPFEVTAEDVYGALLTVDKLGKSLT